MSRVGPTRSERFEPLALTAIELRYRYDAVDTRRNKRFYYHTGHVQSSTHHLMCISDSPLRRAGDGRTLRGGRKTRGA